jgi:hypothetical protein
MIRRLVPIAVAIVLFVAVLLLPGWDQGAEKVPPDTKPRIQIPPGAALPAGHPPIGDARPPEPVLPPGHPPIDRSGSAPQTTSPGGSAPDMTSSGAAAPAPATGGASELPLSSTGLGSAAELAKALSHLDDSDARRVFEEAFRLTFTSQRDSRDFKRANELFRRVLEHDPECAECYRGLAYAEFNTSFDFPGTIALYEKAVALRPDYGEAHYALAFMLGTSDLATGAEHFKRAMELGVTDERNLRERFYSGIE